jgi:hypothetical protein
MFGCICKFPWGNDKISGESREEPRLKKSRSSGPGTNTFESYSHHVPWGKKKIYWFQSPEKCCDCLFGQALSGSLRRSLKCSASYWGFPESNSHHYNWLVLLTILKNISQWERLSHVIWKMKNVWNHQPANENSKVIIIHLDYSLYSHHGPMIPPWYHHLCVTRGCPQHHHGIWVNYNLSLTWRVRPAKAIISPTMIIVRENRVRSWWNLPRYIHTLYIYMYYGILWDVNGF